MEIKLNTTELNELDKKIIKTLYDSLYGTSDDNKNIKDKTSEEKVKFPMIHGQTHDTIMQIIEYINGGTARDISKYTDIKLNTIQTTLYKLEKEQNLLEKSNSKPYKYFLKGENNELKKALKNVKWRKKK